MSSQFSSVRRRCAQCAWPAVSLGGGNSNHGHFMLYQCRACGTKFRSFRKQNLLRWVFKLTYYAIRLHRILTSPRRMQALLAIRVVNEAGLRECIVRMANLW